MDKAIKAVKKWMGKKMDSLVRKDVKRDRKCEKDKKMAKSKKKGI